MFNLRQSKPDVSVIMPVRNSRDYVAAAIGSILRQDLENLELLILEDGSDDDTLDIVRGFKDRRLKIFSDGHTKGIAKRLNEGLDHASSNYVARMDGDDISDPDRLTHQLRFMKQNPQVGVCGTHYRAFNAAGASDIYRLPVYPGGSRAKLLFACPVAHPTVMFSRSLLDRWRLRYDDNARAEDYDLWVRCAAYFDICNVNRVLFNYRTHESQASVANIDAIRNSANASRRSALRHANLDFNEDEFSVHCHLCEGFAIKRDTDFVEVVSWLKKISDNIWQVIDDRVFVEKECQFYLNQTAKSHGFVPVQLRELL